MSYFYLGSLLYTFIDRIEIGINDNKLSKTWRLT